MNGPFPVGLIGPSGRPLARTPKLYQPSDRDPSAFVYFIQGEDEGPIKIGAAIDPVKRMRGMQTGYPYKLRILATHPGGYTFERYLHWYLWRYKIRGEWYKPGPLVMRMAHKPGYLEEVWRVNPDTHLWEKGPFTPLKADRCEICDVDLFAAYGKDKLCLESQCAACIEAAPYREMEAAA